MEAIEKPARALRSSLVISAFVAVIVGFGGSVAVVLAAIKSVGATPEQTSSWIAALCIAMAVTTAVLSIWHRMPIVTAWSTPGAALIASSTGVTMETAAGAFILAAGLILLTAAFRPIGRLVEKIPTAIASAMLAGVLFGFVVAIFGYAKTAPTIVFPLLVAFAILRVYSQAWAVLAVLVLGVALVYALGQNQPVEALRVSSLVLITPVFDPVIVLGLGVPLYLVTMASQNLPGFAVLRAAGYSPPSRSILAVTGLASLMTAAAGAHTSNLAAITAAICTGPDAHPDSGKRWLGGIFYALGYGILAVFGASVVTMFASFPEALIAMIAGIALTGPLASALAASLTEERHRFAAIVTFAVTASGISAVGIGSAFWGLVAGLVIFGLESIARPGR